MSRLEVRVERRLGQLTVLSLSGRCTSSMTVLLREALAAELDRGLRGLLLDGARLEEIEGTGFYEIVLADRQLRARHGALAIYSLNPVIATSMRQANLLGDVDVHPDFAGARRAVEARIHLARHGAAAADNCGFPAEKSVGGEAARRTGRLLIQV